METQSIILIGGAGLILLLLCFCVIILLIVACVGAYYYYYSSTPAVYSSYTNTDFSSSSVGDPLTGTLEECKKKCDTYSNCTGFVVKGGACTFKDNTVTDPVYDTASTYYFKGTTTVSGAIPPADDKEDTKDKSDDKPADKPKSDDKPSDKPADTPSDGHATYNSYANTDFPVIGDIGQQMSGSPDDCMKKCDTYSNCTGFIAKQNYCWFKDNNVKNPVYNKETTYYYKGTAPTSAATPPADQPAKKIAKELSGYTFHPYMDSGGGDLTNPGGDLDNFKTVCDAMKNCKGFNTNGFLKSSITTEDKWGRMSENSTEGLYTKDGYDDAPDETDKTPAYNILPKTDYINQGDLGEQDGTPASCIDICESKSGCTGFVSNGNHCWFKNKNAKTPAYNSTVNYYYKGNAPSGAAIVPPTSKYDFVQGMDAGTDIVNKSGSIDDLKIACDADVNCMGFNTNGVLKTSLPPKDQWKNWTKDSDKGLYIKKLAAPKYSILHHTNYSKQGDITNESGNHVTCQRRCDEIQGCIGFNTNGKKCWFKNSIIQTPSYDSSGAFYYNGNVPPGINGNYTGYPNVDYDNQGDIKSIKGNDITCPNECDKTNGCVGFTTNGEKCYLKNNSIKTPYKTGGKVFYYKGTYPPPGMDSKYSFLPYVDYDNGGDISRQAGNALTCPALCDRSTDCVGFVTDGSTCWFKNNTIGTPSYSDDKSFFYKGKFPPNLLSK